MKQFQGQYFSNNAELAQFLGVDYEETTTGMNGYPENLKYVITPDSIDEILELQQKLEAAGFEVEQLSLHKKIGWQLWNRSSTIIEKGMMMKASDQDYYFDFDSDADEDQIKQEIFEFLGLDDMISDCEDARNYDSIKKLINQVDCFYEQLPSNEGVVRVFCDGNNDYLIEYYVNENSTGYGYDTNHYLVGIRVVSFKSDEE